MVTSPRELKLKLTDEQKAEIVRFIAATNTANLQVDVLFEADLKANAVAPTSVLVGNAV